MRKRGFSAEILCLFFIISVTILFGKILVDVKSIIRVQINELIPKPAVVVDYNAYSFRTNEVYEDLNDVTIIRSTNDLKKFKEYLVDKEISIDWLDEKLDSYNKENFDDHTIVVLSIVNDNNVTVTRINGITKKNNDVTIGISKHYKSVSKKTKYTWLAVLDLTDSDSQILINSN
jgi:hypothetical protein